MENKTRHDAFMRITNAQSGCLVGATKEYLVALEEFVSSWLKSINQSIEIEEKYSEEKIELPKWENENKCNDCKKI